MNFDHIAHRDKEPFENIKKGTKVSEYRLNDEKRQKIKIGDTIKLLNRDNENRCLYVKVIGLSYFDNFEDCFEVFKDKVKTYEKEILKRVYSKEKIEKYGVITIHFNLIGNNEK